MKHSRHATYNIRVHIVFVTKYRKSVFNNEMLIELESIFKSLVNIVEFNGEVDHVHIIVDYPPTVSVTRIVNVLKGVSSRLMRKKYIDIVRLYYGDGIGLWSKSYFAASVGDVNFNIIKNYIKNQNRPK